MKLLTKTTLYFLLAMVPLLGAGGYLLYKQYSAQINERADKELAYEEVQWIQYLEAATANGSNFILRSPDLLIFPTGDEPSPYADLTTTYGTKAREKTQIPFRKLTQVVSINGIPYQLVIRKSQEQKLALVANITYLLFLVLAGLFLATLLFNWIISKRIWKPFHASLQKVRNLELQQMETIHFDETTIAEFNELNASLNTMVQRIQSDYLNMKEFTENAAHEMQTPLAAAQSKLELLLQDATLNDRQLGTIVQTTEALSRLGKLNQSLLLLAKIENNQFETSENIDLNTVTKKYLRLFEEMIQEKNLQVTTELNESFPVMMHSFLADSLISNLLGNAIKYNHKGGSISIVISNSAFCIANSSHLPALPSDQLFKRFKAAIPAGQQSTGLGLAIVKRIIDHTNLFIRYRYQESEHRFCIERCAS